MPNETVQSSPSPSDPHDEIKANIQRNLDVKLADEGAVQDAAESIRDDLVTNGLALKPKATPAAKPVTSPKAPAAASLKLSDVTEPVFDLVIAGGETKSYDLFTLFEAIEAADGTGAGTMADSFDAIRRAFGFPPQADVDAVQARNAQLPDGQSGEPVPFTLSRAHCHSLRAAVTEAVAALPSSRKLLDLARRR